MKQFTLLVITLIIALSSNGQTDFKRNVLYLEAGGNGLLDSLNYERQLTAMPGIGIRIGLGF